uniref:Uncharacterized protein n=1 Tax=Trichuris muris TaxID=70415 RepID=A0A5S6QD05_TRIMR
MAFATSNWLLRTGGRLRHWMTKSLSHDDVHDEVHDTTVIIDQHVEERYCMFTSSALYLAIGSFVKFLTELNGDVNLNTELYLLKDFGDQEKDVEEFEVPKVQGDLFESVACAIYHLPSNNASTATPIYCSLLCISWVYFNGQSLGRYVRCSLSSCTPAVTSDSTSVVQRNQFPTSLTDSRAVTFAQRDMRRSRDVGKSSLALPTSQKLLANYANVKGACVKSQEAIAAYWTPGDVASPDGLAEELAGLSTDWSADITVSADDGRGVNRLTELE